MDKKKELKKGTDSHNFMDKFLTKLKMSKHGGEDKPTGSGNGKKFRETESTALEEKKPLITWEKNGLTPDNLMEFSNQLEQFLEHVQTLKNVAFYTYEYPNKLNDKLEKEAMELRNLFIDVRTAAIDIQRLQKQRYLVKKEKCLATKKLDKLREEGQYGDHTNSFPVFCLHKPVSGLSTCYRVLQEMFKRFYVIEKCDLPATLTDKAAIDDDDNLSTEIRELESIIYAYAKPLHSKWEAIKNCQKADVLENFMNEVMGKHRAIEILQELVRRKLAKITKKASTVPFNVKKNISSTNTNNKVKNQDKNNSNWSVTPFSEFDKFGPTIDKVIRGTTDRDILRMNRRKRQKELREERRRQNSSSAAATTTSGSNAENSGGLDLQLVPIDNFPNEETDEVGGLKHPVATTANLSARSPPIINIEFTSDDDSVSLSSSDFTIENFVQTANTEAQMDLQNEMRSVLQALFGEIRQIPQIFPSRNRHNNSGNDLRSSRTASH